MVPVLRELCQQLHRMLQCGISWPHQQGSVMESALGLQTATLHTCQMQ